MKPIAALLTSRKFWLTAITIVGAVVLRLHGGMTDLQLAEIIAANVSVLVLAIAHEDSGAKSAPQSIAAGGDVNIAPSAEITKPDVTKEST